LDDVRSCTRRNRCPDWDVPTKTTGSQLQVPEYLHLWNLYRTKVVQLESLRQL